MGLTPEQRALRKRQLIDKRRHELANLENTHEKYKFLNLIHLNVG